MLDVQDLKVHFPVRRGFLNRVIGAAKAVDGVSFSIQSGETLALVGESGCGKSTTGNAILGLLKPTGGEVRFEGKARDTVYLRDMQVIFQDPASALNPRMKIGTSIEEPMRASGMKAAQRKARAIELLRLVGFPDEVYERFPNEMSGGQRQRVVIARALALEPKLIVCDEPVSALDVSIRSQILNLLVDLQRKLGISYLFISHDMSVVRYFSDRVAVMYLGRIVEEAPRDLLFEQPLHPYTEALLSAVPLADPDRQRNKKKIILSGELPSPLNPPVGCCFVGRCPIKVAACATTRPQLTDVGGGHKLACIVRGPAASEARS